ncbi:MAG: hypothetical protein QGG36_14510, partial [Pirellulaceae bacterium]|nr:hypothetical protein [Pirellulaceae bacterium]
TLDARRNFIEQSQVARASLDIISGDLRRCFVPYEPDLSALESLAANAAQSALGGALGGAASGESGDQDGGESGGSGGGSGSGSSSSEPTGSTSSTIGDIGDLTGEITDSMSTTDIAGSTTVPITPGLYGNQYELQIDASRLPRFDEYFRVQPADFGELVDIPSAVKTIAYYIQPDGTTTGAEDPFSQATGGLVRRELDRAVSQYASYSGNVASLQSAGKIIAPEVVSIEFRYFDGLQWLLEWDSEQMGGLPMAIEIVIGVRDVRKIQAGVGFLPGASSEPVDEDQLTFYRKLMRLPTAKLEPAEETEDFSELGL